MPRTRRKYSLSISALAENLGQIERFVLETASALDLKGACVGDLAVVARRAARHVMVHGYGDRGGDLEIELARDGDVVSVSLSDDAPPLDPTIVAEALTRCEGDGRQAPEAWIPASLRHELRPMGGNVVTVARRLESAALGGSSVQQPHREG